MAESMPSILIVDDQPAVRTALSVLFDVHDLPTIAVDSPEAALDVIRREDIGVVVQDMNFRDDTTSGKEGIALFGEIKRLDPDLPVVLMTAWTSVETAVELVKQGANDYLAKPWDDDKLVRTVQNLLRIRRLQLENTRLRAAGRRARHALAETYDLGGLVYASQEMHAVVTLAVNVARSAASVLITGPNGSGKEMLARVVHANSRRAGAPLVTVNAGGLPDQLLEAELFGAEAGAYTGAQKQRIGRFEAADGGTLFLDEIGNLSMSGQAKLLRVLQTGEFERLGSSQTRRADVRIISATNADLKQRIAEDSFREDLYFRLAVIELAVPALHQRPDDILPLAERFLQQFATAGQPVWQLGDDASEALLRYDWPGNVRELHNRIQRATVVARSGTVRADDLGFSDRDLAGDGAPAAAAPPEDEPERAAIERVLVECDGVVSRAAAQLGLSRQALYRRMQRLGVSLERKPRRE